MMKRFEAVIFDMDGVIFDSELLVIKCWQVVADKYGIKNIEDTCHKCLGLNKDATKELMLGVYGADFPYDEYKAEMSALFHEQAAGGKLPMKPGVTGLLQTLKKNGRKVFLSGFDDFYRGISEICTFQCDKIKRRNFQSTQQ